MSRWLPTAEQLTIPCCGHVPQVECPEETERVLLEFFARADAAQAEAERRAGGARATGVAGEIRAA